MPSKSTPNSDGVASAQEAGLRYVSDRRRGIRRQMSSPGCKYIATTGRMIRNKAEIARINKLAIPRVDRRLDLSGPARTHPGNGTRRQARQAISVSP